jgi:predicted Zn-ribbon and HTH transcriptional regulator
MKKFKCYFIKWDADEDVKLPSTIYVEVSEEDIKEYNLIQDRMALEDFLSDAITKESGFCHKGFCYDLISNESGKCPYCDSEDIEYGTFELEGEEGYYDITCNECEQSSKEWYKMVFIETIG